MAFDAWASELQPRARAVVAAEFAATTIADPSVVRALSDFEGALQNASGQFHKGALTRMASAIDDDSGAPSTSDYVQAWKDGTQNVVDVLGRAGRDIREPSLAVLALREVALKDAKTFWNGLADIDPVGARAALIDYRAMLEKKIVEIDKHFETLGRNGRDLMEQESRLSHQMTAALQDAVGRQSDIFSRIANVIDTKFPNLKDPAKWIRKTGAEILGAVVAATPWSESAANWQEFADKMSKPGAGYFRTGKEVGIPAGELARAAPYLQRDIGMYVSDTFQDKLKQTLPDATGVIIQMLGTVADQIESTARNYRELRDAFLSILPNHGSVLVLMSDTRKKIDDFIRNNPIETMRATVEAVGEGLDRWRNGAMSSGLQADATAFASIAKAALQRRLDAAQKSHDAFVTENANTFLGTLNGPTEKIVFDPAMVLDDRGRIVSLGLDERLAGWREQLIVIEPALANYQRDLIEAIDTMPEDIRNDMSAQVTAAFAPIRAAIADAATRARAAMDTEQSVAGKAQVNQDMDITPLREKLK